MELLALLEQHLAAVYGACYPAAADGDAGVRRIVHETLLDGVIARVVPGVVILHAVSFVFIVSLRADVAHFGNTTYCMSNRQVVVASPRCIGETPFSC